MAVSKSKSVSSIQPDPQQQAAIGHVFGPMLVVAGAGTGKTTVLIRRIAHLIREGHARPDEILALTYTDNAAKEMLTRVRRELGSSNAKGLQVATFHAYCNELLQRSKRGFGVLDDKQLWVFLRRNIRELRLNHFVRAANVSKFLDDLLDFIRRCHDELVGPEQYANYVRRIESGDLTIPRVSKSKDADALTDDEALGRCREIAFVFETVERILGERNLGTFGHMILRANELLAEDSALLERERSHARFILVDEFQDTNFAQIKVLEKLAGRNGLTGEGARATQNVFAVGDPDQGIYRFRGASSDAFELFQKHFPDTKLVVLGKNRRSTTPVLTCAHALISENPSFALGESRYQRSPLISARDEQDKAALRSRVGAVLVTGNLMEATDLVATLLEHKKRSRCAWKEIGILYRSHFHRDEVAGELPRQNIPFSIEGLDVVDTPDVRDLLACLGAVVSNDSVALFRVAPLPQFSIDPNELRSAMKALPRETRRSIALVLPQVKGGKELQQTIAQARDEITNQKTVAALLALIRIFQLRGSPAVQALIEFAGKWEKLPITESGSPGEFLDYMEYFREARGVIPLAAREEENVVRLMTVHAAKGLEFDHVFVLRAVSNSFPAAYKESLIEFPPELRTSTTPSQNDKTLHGEEERRLFYVAMTRARDTLTLYGPYGKGKTEKTPPGYLRDLLKHRDTKHCLVERKTQDFQTDIFGAAEAPALSRLGEWVALRPASDLAATLSASAIERYEICPLQFKLEREWRLPADASAALQYGASIHRVLLAYYDAVRWERAMSEEEVVDLFRTDLAAAGITDRYQHDLYEEQGIRQLQEFLAGATQSQPDVLHTEEHFSVKLGPTTLVGRIDRIDRIAGDRVALIDYKTGKPKSQEDADESLQLSLYALAAREKWGYDVERLVLHNLEGNIAITTGRSEIEIQEAKLRVEDVAGKIAAGDFKGKVGMHCTFCAYRALCPHTEKRVPEFFPAAALKS